MKKSLLISTAIMFGLLFTACKKNNDNNMSAYKPGMSYQLVATNTNYAMARTTGTANIRWTSAFATPDVIKFEAKQDNLQVEYKSTNNAQIDLMSSVAVNFGSFTLPAGTYDEIELSIDLDKDGANPTLELDGTVTNGIVTLPVSVQVNEPVELKTEQHSVTVANYDYVAVTTLDMSAVTVGVTATMLLNAQLTSGTIVISSTSNHDLYKMILDNLRNKHHHCEFEAHHH